MAARVEARLAGLRVDALLSPAAVEENLTGARPTAFPLAQYTERTDKLAQGLLEGRVGVLVDGLPLGFLLPATLAETLRVPEDTAAHYIYQTKHFNCW